MTESRTVRVNLDILQPKYEKNNWTVSQTNSTTRYVNPSASEKEKDRNTC